MLLFQLLRTTPNWLLFNTAKSLNVKFNKIHGVKYTSTAVGNEKPAEDLENVSGVSQDASTEEVKAESPSSASA
ncbi:unnamed protein product [Hanseniaspora opuntiae]